MSAKPNFKVLFLIDSLGPGGSERSIVELLPYLSQSNIQSLIVCLYPQKEGFEAELRNKGFQIHFLPSGWLRRFRELRRILKVEKPDLIHTSLFESDILGRLASIGSSIPVLTSLVNTSYDEARLGDPNLHPSKVFIVKKIDSWTARLFTKHFHAVSQSVKKSAVDHLRIAADRITVVYRGRENERLGERSLKRRDEIRAKLGLHQEHQVLICVGRQEYQKGHAYILKALDQLMGKHERLILLIVGRTGSASPELERLQKAAHLNGTVRVLGYRSDVSDLLAAADIFVFPSLYEGLPGAMIEAMALGLPIVASDLPPIHEVIEPGANALLVPPAQVEPLAQAIELLLNNPKQASDFGARSKQIFYERFTMRRYASEMIALYQRLISGVRFMSNA